MGQGLEFEQFRMGQGVEFEQFRMGQGHPKQNIKKILAKELNNHKSDGTQHDIETMKKLVSNPNIPITNMFMGCNQLDPLVEQINALTTDELTTIENDVGFHRLSEFEQLKEKYHSRLLVLNTLNTNKKIATKDYNNELLKDEDDEMDPEIIELYTSITADITNIESELEKIEKELKSMQSKDSPFEVSELNLPRTYGTVDTPSFKKLECVPNVDVNNSITDVWNFLVEIGSDLGLSKIGYERALYLKLDSEKREIWQKYRKLSLKEAIFSLVKTFDNPPKSYHVKEKIANYSCLVGTRQ